MLKSHLTKVLFAAFALSFAITTSLFGQGVTTSAITGSVTDASGAPISGAIVLVVNESTALKATTVTRSNGAYDISGLQTGGPLSLIHI